MSHEETIKYIIDHLKIEKESSMVWDDDTNLWIFNEKLQLKLGDNVISEVDMSES